MSEVRELYEAVLEGDSDLSRKCTEALITTGFPPGVILTQALMPAMTEVGARFERQEYYVPEMLVAGLAMHAGLAMLRPLLASSGARLGGRVAIGTIQGDLHDIGKNLVTMMLEGAGFNVTDLGVDVHPAKFVEAVQNGAQLIGVSALLTTTMARITDVIKAMEDAGVRSSAKVIVGGAPLTRQFAADIGADGYAPDASRAVRAAKSLIGA